MTASIASRRLYHVGASIYDDEGNLLVVVPGASYRRTAAETLAALLVARWNRMIDIERMRKGRKA